MIMAHSNYWAALQATPNQNIEAASSVQQKDKMADGSGFSTGNPGSVIVPQYGSSKITVFVWGKNIIPKFLGNTK